MITEDLKIPTNTKTIEAFAMYKENVKPNKVFLIFPGQGYTINHFLLDFLWRMAAEQGFYAVKAEYRGYTYRHLGDEPYDHAHAAEDVKYVLDYFIDQGYSQSDITVCAKSLGTIALGSLVAEIEASFEKAILLTPVLYMNKEDGTFSQWFDYQKKVKNSYLIFGSIDPYCDLETAKNDFPNAIVDCYEGADHGLHLTDNYEQTIEIQKEIIEKVKKFICE